MVKTLQPIGNSLGLIIDKPILNLMNITADTPLELEAARDGKGLTIRPIRDGVTPEHKARVRGAALRATKNHRETLKRLAE